jgi:hypothetical protein
MLFFLSEQQLKISVSFPLPALFSEQDTSIRAVQIRGGTDGGGLAVCPSSMYVYAKYLKTIISPSFSHIFFPFVLILLFNL